EFRMVRGVGAKSVPLEWEAQCGFAGCDEGQRFFIQEEERDETPPADLEDAGGFGQVVLHVLRKHMRKDGGEKHKVKGGIFEWEAIFRREETPAWIEHFTADIALLESETREPWRDSSLAPPNGISNDVEALNFRSSGTL